MASVRLEHQAEFLQVARAVSSAIRTRAAQGFRGRGELLDVLTRRLEAQVGLRVVEHHLHHLFPELLAPRVERPIADRAAEALECSGDHGVRPAALMA